VSMLSTASAPVSPPPLPVSAPPAQLDERVGGVLQGFSAQRAAASGDQP
jgi:hypothetical protein